MTNTSYNYLLLLLLFLLSSCVAKNSNDISASCDELAENLNIKSKVMTLTEARHAYAKHVDTCKEDIDSLYRLAIIDLKIGDFKQSKQGLLEVIDRQASYTKAYYNLGVIYSSGTEFKNTPKAKLCFQRYLTLAPESPKKKQLDKWLKENKEISIEAVLLVRSRPYPLELENGLNDYRLKNYEAAALNFEKHLTLNPTDLDIRLKLGVCYLSMKKLKLSRNEFLKILEINESIERAYYYLGVLYSAKSNFRKTKKAKFFFKKYLVMHPESDQAAKIQKWIKSH